MPKGKKQNESGIVPPRNWNTDIMRYVIENFPTAAQQGITQGELQTALKKMFSADNPSLQSIGRDTKPQVELQGREKGKLVFKFTISTPRTRKKFTVRM